MLHHIANITNNTTLVSATIITYHIITAMTINLTLSTSTTTAGWSVGQTNFKTKINMNENLLISNTTRPIQQAHWFHLVSALWKSSQVYIEHILPYLAKGSKWQKWHFL